MRLRKNRARLVTSFALALTLAVPARLLAADEMAQWINHLGFWPASQYVATALVLERTGLAVSTTAAGDDQFVEQIVQVPAGYLVAGVQVCYDQGDTNGFLSRINLAQLAPPGPAVLVLDDVTDWSAAADCVSVPTPDPVDPSQGALRLGLGFKFLDSDPIVIRSVALWTIPDPNSPAAQALAQLRTDLNGLVDYVDLLAAKVNGLEVDVSQLRVDLAELEGEVEALENHTHIYLTGKGEGHNNTTARTSEPSIVPAPTPTPIPPPAKGKEKKH